jgi:hypothetical protein
MLKRIPKSDISIRPFKAYKQWAFDNDSFEISILEANINSDELSGEYPKNSIYGQLHAQFYNEYIDNPFLRFGHKSVEYKTGSVSERYIDDSAKVISIPQIYVGEGIKKGSVFLKDENLNLNYTDAENGNLILANGDIVNFITFDNETGNATFVDFLGNSYNINVEIINFETAEITGSYQGEPFTAIITYFNLESGEMLVDNFEFLDADAAEQPAGNVFYNQGLIVLTRRSNELLNGNWDLSFKSTKTIYEHEYLLIVNPDEFNISQNPSAIKEVGFEYEFITGSDGKIYKVNTKTGARYIRKKMELENGEVLDFRYGSRINSATSGGFEHWDLSGSVDTTGSFLTPFITTIGLYDDDMDLLAVAKLPQAIKSEPDFPVNFIIRFDI